MMKSYFQNQSDLYLKRHRYTDEEYKVLDALVSAQPYVFAFLFRRVEVLSQMRL